MSNPLPNIDETSRLASLRALEVLDSAVEPVFDAIVMAALAACGAEIALLSLVDGERQWFKANVGLDGVTETPRDVSFCAHTITNDEVMVVNDAERDPRFVTNPLVIGEPHIRFYAGAPIILTGGQRIGAVCIIGRSPRTIDEKQKQALIHLAAAAAAALEMRQRSQGHLVASETILERYNNLYKSTPAMLHSIDSEGRFLAVSDTWLTAMGYVSGEVIGRLATDFMPPDSAKHVRAAIREFFRAAQPVETEYQMLRKDGGVIDVSVSAVVEREERTGIQRSLAVVHDITARKIIKQQLRESRDRLQSIIDGTNVATWEWNVQSNELRVDNRWAEMIGYSLDEIAPLSLASWSDRAHPDDLARALSILERHFSGEIDRYDCEVRLRHKDGHWVSVHERGRVASWTSDGKPLWMMGTHADMSDRVQKELALREAKLMLDRTGQIANVGGWTIDLPSGDLHWSDQTCRLLDLTPGTSSSLEEALSAYAPQSRAVITAALEAAKMDGTPWDLEVGMVTFGGRHIWVRVSGMPEFEGGRPVRLVGAVQDITRRYEAEQALAESQQLLQVTLESIGDAVITTDIDSCVTWLNPVAERMTGWTRADGYGKPVGTVFNILHEETRSTATNPVAACLAEGKMVGLAERTLLVSRDGTEYGIEDTAAPIRDRSGRILGAVLVFHDVSDQRRLSKAMQYRVTHDPMTGLINREEFEHRLERVLRHAQESNSINALLYIDLDEFKIVNDSCGHAAGDLLLKQVSRLLETCVRKRDTLARLGGDEFGVILEHCDAEQAERVAQKICDEMNGFRFTHDDKRYRVGASIGLVPVNAESRTEAAVLQAADTACYAAKDAGRNRVHTWRDTDQSICVKKGEMRWASRIEQAIDEDRFVLYGQRIEPLRGSPDGLHLEVLVRMLGNDDIVIPPGAFLPAAERYHLASRLDRWVVRHVFEMMNRDPAQFNDVSTIAVNLSGQSIGDREFHRFIAEMISTARFEVGKLCFEVTETAVISHIDEARRFIGDVRGLGIRVALDDFGAGASSFGYLKSLPVNYLKIDGQFVRDILSDPLDLAAVRCFTEVARVVEIETIAEFVETQAILAKLREIGVDYAQGYLLHKPEPIGDLMRNIYPLIAA